MVSGFQRRTVVLPGQIWCTFEKRQIWESGSKIWIRKRPAGSRDPKATTGFVRYVIVSPRIYVGKQAQPGVAFVQVAKMNRALCTWGGGGKAG